MGKLPNQSDFILGLDIGSNSIGFALIGLEKGRPSGILHVGARVFEAGVDGDIESGRDASRGAGRREHRAARRMLQRRNRRLIKLAHILQRGGLLPAGDIKSAVLRDRFFAGMDRAIIARYTANLPKDDPRRKAISFLPYFLRAQALDAALPLDELGRLLYHLAQHRGFLSNRKIDRPDETDESDSGKKKAEELGKVKEGIADLTREMEEAHARTLGEYFSKIDPETKRIRKRWTARRMYLDEFEAIWTAQARHHTPRLTEELKKQIHEAIFFQRPLKNQKHLIGNCSLEPQSKRSRWGLLLPQRFRMLSAVNNLTMVNTETGEILPLNAEQRSALLTALETEGDITFARVRKLPGLKKCKFNLEEGGEKKLPGNRTAARLLKVFGPERWSAFSADEKDRIVQDLLGLEDNPDILRRRGMDAWGLDDEAAEHFANITLQPGYCSLSTKAIKKLLPYLEVGVTYAAARMKAYGGVTTRTQPADELAPLANAVPSLRNPAVTRALTELRSVVNTIVCRYGKPAEIHIELARDLKKNRLDRKEIWNKNRKNQSAREGAAQEIRDKARLNTPRGADIEKVLLANECEWICPYTGKQISMTALVGPTPQFDIEHIIPLSKCLDNSFFNKTLCYHEENRNVKKGRTPFEAYGSDAERYEAILQRVRKFTGSAAKEKLRRFQAQDWDDFDDFASRQLNDTRYASRLASDYLGTLYGGKTDEDHGLRVFAGRGGVTKFLRDEWDLNSILGDGGAKNRDDHRHHAVDAVAIALTAPSTVKMLSDAAVQAEKAGRRRFAPIAPPWPCFLDDVRKAIGELNVSHRLNRRVAGPLHEESVYGPPCDENGRPDPKGQYHHIRKPLESLSKGEMGAIADPKVKAAVLAALGAGDPKKTFSNPANLPCLTTKAGRRIPIKKVRLLKKTTTAAVGSDHRQRHVALGSNHHVEIYETKDSKGNTKWDGEVVSTMEAHRRLRAKEPLVRRDHGPNTKFVFSLCGGDIIEINNNNGSRELYVVRTVSDVCSRVEYVQMNDARKKKDIMSVKGDWKTTSWEPLRKLNCQKVIVTTMGDVRRAND